MITVLGLDPGTANMAWSVVQIWSPTRFKICGVGMVHRPIRELKGNIRPDVKDFVRSLKKIIKFHNVTHIGAERFQARGLRGNTGELVAFMLGLLATFNQPSVFITASQWKNNFNRHHDLKAMYAKSQLKPHEIDACSIALYTGMQSLGHKDAFMWLKNHHKKYLTILERTSETLRAKKLLKKKKELERNAKLKQKGSRRQIKKPR